LRTKIFVVYKRTFTMTSTDFDTPRASLSETEDDDEDKISWEDRFAGTDGVFDVELLRAHYNVFGANDGPFASSKILGLREYYTTHMRVLRMKISNATNNKMRYGGLRGLHVKKCSRGATRDI
jgi:hypothetical protein